MTISATASRNDYTGNNATSVYPYTYRIFVDTDLLVTVRLISSGAQTTLAKGTDYSVSGAGAATGGNVTLVNASQAWLNADGTLKSTYDLTVRRVRPVTQTTDIRNQGDFYPEVHEDSFDHLIMVDQQQQDEIDRSIKLPETLSSAVFDGSLPATLPLYPGSAIIVNAAGNGWSLGTTTTDIARLAAIDTYANLKAAAAGAPSLTRQGYATDIKQVMFYTADVSVGDGGWVVLGG